MWARSAWIFFRSKVCCVTSYRDHWARKQRWADWGRLATLKTSFWEIGCIIDYTVVYSWSDHFWGSIFYVFVKEIKFSIAQKERCQKWLLLFRRFLGIGNRKKELLGKVSANELAKCNLVGAHSGIFGNNDCYCALLRICFILGLPTFLGFPDEQQSTGLHFLYLPNCTGHSPTTALLRSEVPIWERYAGNWISRRFSADSSGRGSEQIGHWTSQVYWQQKMQQYWGERPYQNKQLQCTMHFCTLLLLFCRTQ
jgi:hypothetical protein